MKQTTSSVLKNNNKVFFVKAGDVMGAMIGYYMACANADIIAVIVGSVLGLIALEIVFKFMD